MSSQQTHYPEIIQKGAEKLHQMDFGATLKDIKRALTASGLAGLLMVTLLEDKNLHPVLASMVSAKPFITAYMMLGWGYLGEQYQSMTEKAASDATPPSKSVETATNP